jgi:hypothetical protein
VTDDPGISFVIQRNNPAGYVLEADLSVDTRISRWVRDLMLGNTDPPVVINIADAKSFPRIVVFCHLRSLS